MSYKRLTYISLFLFMVLGILAFIHVMSIASPQTKNTMGAHFFPQVVSVLLLIFCLFSFLNTAKKRDEKVELRNIGHLFFTIILVILFLSLWNAIGRFYILSLIFLAVLIYSYNQEKYSLNKVIQSIVVSLVITFVAYMTFDYFLKVTF